MNNPLKTIKELASDRTQHHSRLLELELFKRQANQRISDLEKETVSLEAFQRLIRRVEELEKKAKAPVGLDGTRRWQKGEIAPGGLKEKILKLLKANEGFSLIIQDFVEELDASEASVYSILSRLVNAGQIVRVGRGRYSLPAATARAVGQRNGR